MQEVKGKFYNMFTMISTSKYMNILLIHCSKINDVAMSSLLQSSNLQVIRKHLTCIDHYRFYSLSVVKNIIAVLL